MTDKRDTLDLAVECGAAVTVYQQSTRVEFDTVEQFKAFCAKIEAPLLERIAELDRERDESSAHVERLREFIEYEGHDITIGGREAQSHLDDDIEAVLAETPRQSLARHNNKIRQECADACRKRKGWQDGQDKAAEWCASNIEATKEAE